MYIDFDIRLLILVVLLFSSAIFMVIFRKNALIAYIALWLFIPNRLDNFIGIEGIPLYTFVEVLSACMLLIFALLYSGKGKNNFEMSKSSILTINLEKKIVYFFAFILFFQLIISIIISNFYLTISEIPSGHFIQNFVREFAAIIFFFSCIKLLRTQKQVERVLYAFVVSVIFLTIELAIVWLTGIDSFSFDKQFNFNSVFFNNWTTVSIISLMGFFSGFYFYRQYQNRYWLLVCALGLLISFISLSRTSILAAGVGFAVLIYVEFYLNWSRVKRFMFIFFTIITMSSIYFNIDRIESMVFKDKTVLSGSSTLLDQGEYLNRRLQLYARTDSLYVRLGIQLRAYEVIKELFPFGTGVNMLRYYMPSDIDRGQLFQSSNSISQGYRSVAFNNKITESHNGYIEQIASYGVLGIISLAVLFGAFIHNFRTLKRHMIERTSLFSFALGVSTMFLIFYIFLGYPRIYIPIFFTLHLSFLLVSFLKSKKENQLV